MTEWYLIGNKIREGLNLASLHYHGRYMGFVVLSIADFHRSISKRFLSCYKYLFVCQRKVTMSRESNEKI